MKIYIVTYEASDTILYFGKYAAKAGEIYLYNDDTSLTETNIDDKTIFDYQKED